MKKIFLNFNLLLKRIFDIFVSIILIILLIPLWITVGILIKKDSEGPIFFVQNRLTKNGKVFKMYKFRTMIQNAEKLGTGLFNYKDDPRVTKIGRILRNTSIDELPQVFNVLKGDISLVGPRPSVTYELGDYETLNKKFKKRFLVKGGITGLAQVKGRNENSWLEKVEFDNKYIDLFEKYGCIIDIYILIQTVVKVFKKSDIYVEKLEENMDEIESAKKSEEEIIKLAHIQDEEILENKELVKEK